LPRPASAGRGRNTKIARAGREKRGVGKMNSRPALALAAGKIFGGLLG